MYLEFLNLKAYPFQVAPDADFLYLSKSHARAKAYLDYAIWSPDGFVVVTGEIGCGKTILIKRLLSELPQSVVVAKIFQTQLDELEFLQLMLVEFGLKRFDAKKVELLDMLNTFLINQHLQKRQVVLIVDEAQNLSERVLEEIRLLSGLEAQNEKILNVILVGQSELREKMDSAGMQQLAQRVQLRFHIKALNRSETKDYIEHRLKIAGAQNAGLFPAETIPLIHRYTGGVPRLINILCDTALTAAFAEHIPLITTKLIKVALKELQWVPYVERTSNDTPQASEPPPVNPEPAWTTDVSPNTFFHSQEIEEKLNRLYEFVPKFATNIARKMKDVERQLDEIRKFVKKKNRAR